MKKALIHLGYGLLGPFCTALLLISAFGFWGWLITLPVVLWAWDRLLRHALSEFGATDPPGPPR